MLPFFKKKSKQQPTLDGQEAQVSSKELLGEEETEDSREQEVHPVLSVHPEWNLASEDWYAFQFLNMECPPLAPNQLSLSGIELNQAENGTYQITAFIRNSLSKAIQLKETNLVLLNEEDEVLGRKAFDLSDAGKIPAESSRPWQFTFEPEELFSEEVPEAGWKLAFQLKPSSRRHSLELEESWESSLAASSRQQLEDMVERLDPPKAGEFNFMGLKAKRTENGDLHVTMLIRNGSEKDITLEEFPLEIIDASNEIVARGGFKFEQFKVKANTSKPWTFIFPSHLILKDEIDLSSWTAQPPKQAKTNIQSK
ncbi:accessory Sec system S-layer assembly protein [Salsuginibacillus halophilus]|uniref:Accessory Sec system S-layer assembly protein n=1 Tax=Salsuginibacillus halophilus TaxID=517424 RepID=A0A2P8HQQ7_9BACI|nr:accessory Sec system S-layer assembly protein [Salsuginibacillus halophilus]PSL48522.1 accessory Sec system S-layer assembly protein [Salsuginibacillus halophilus]